MKKEEYIERYGKEKYEKHIEDTIQWQQGNSELVRENSKRKNKNWCQKEGKFYEKMRQYQMGGIPHTKNIIRCKHRRIWQVFKQIIAPNSQIHHEWIPETANYRGVALVETDQHIHGFIDVIQILEGEITLFSETEIRGM